MRRQSKIVSSNKGINVKEEEEDVAQASRESRKNGRRKISP